MFSVNVVYNEEQASFSQIFSSSVILKKVAVPVRLEQDRIGSAILLAARVRPKFIGGAV